MPRASVRKNYFNFIAGKNSDASSLVAPENTASILENIELDSDGSLSRRLGLDYEEGFSLQNVKYTLADLQANSVSFGEWRGVDNTSTNYWLIRVGDFIEIYTQDSSIVSDNFLARVGMSGFALDVNFSKDTQVQFSSGKGVIIVTGESYKPFFISIDLTESSPVFSTTEIEIEIRDFEGLVDEFDDDETPDGTQWQFFTSFDKRRYNYFNQGWGELVIRFGELGLSKDLLFEDLRHFFAELDFSPSNLHIPHTGMRADPDRDGKESFAADQVIQTYQGGALAPRGKFLIKPLVENRRSLNAFFTIPLIEPAPVFMPATSAFFEGRAWFGSVEGNIFFSQIVTDLTKIPKCYQDQDPTSRDLNELLDTDGGVIALPQAGKVLKLIEAGNSLLVIASEGIWSISGGEANFTANSTSVRKVSEIKPLGASSIVQVAESILFWSDEGIFTISPDNISGRYQTQPISINRIDEDLKLIPTIAKENAFASYDKINKKVFWAFNSELSDGEKLLNKYNSILVYDIKLNAFYDFKISEVGVGDNVSFISGVFPSTGSLNTSIDSLVTVNGDVVQVNAEDVSSGEIVRSVDTVQTAAITFGYNSSDDTFSLTFSNFRDRAFVDWKSVDTIGAGYSSIIETNPESLGEAGIDKQAKYAQTFYDTREDDGDLPRGVLLTARWEWAENSSTGRFSNPQQAIKPKRVHGPDNESKPNYDGFGVGFTRLKIRGHGKSLVLRYTSETGKDFRLLGWSLPFLGEIE